MRPGPRRIAWQGSRGGFCCCCCFYFFCLLFLFVFFVLFCFTLCFFFSFPFRLTPVSPSFVLRSVFVDFLHFHPPVLKPDFHLSLGEVEEPGHLVPAVPGEIHIEQKLLLQFQRLVLGVRAALFPGGPRVEPVSSGVIWINVWFLSVCLTFSIVFRECAFVALLIPINCRRAVPRAPGGARRGGTRRGRRWRRRGARGSRGGRRRAPWAGSCRGSARGARPAPGAAAAPAARGRSGGPPARPPPAPGRSPRSSC